MRWLEYTIFLALVVGLVKPVGLYLARVFERKPTFLDQVLCPVERMLYRVFRIDPEREMSAPVYLLCFILFTVLGTVLLFAVLLLQAWLPGGPHDRYLTTPMTVDLAVNTARELRDHDNLAGLWRRNDAALLGPSDVAWQRRIFSPAPRGWRSASPLFVDSPANDRPPSAISGLTSCAQRCGCSCRFR